MEDYKVGRQLGREFVPHDAVAVKGVKALIALHKVAGDNWGRLFYVTEADAYTVAEEMYFAMRPDDEKDCNEARAFWDAVVPAGAGQATTELVQGFCEGVIEVFPTRK
jgi:hypothetical protein